MKGKVHIGAGAVLLLTALYYLSGMGQLAALLCAAAVHELGHLAALKLCRVDVRGLRFGAGGLDMAVSGFTGASERLVCYAAGPAAGLLYCLAVRRVFPSSAIYSLLLSTYNLLPVLPLDGGRMLECLLSEVLCVKHTVNIMYALCLSIAVLLCTVGLILLHGEQGAAVFAAGICLLYHIITGYV